MFFKEPLTEWFFVKPKLVLLWHRSKNPLSSFIFKSEADLKRLQSKYKPLFQDQHLHLQHRFSVFVPAGDWELIPRLPGSKPPVRCRTAARWPVRDSTSPSGTQRGPRDGESYWRWDVQRNKIRKKLRKYFDKWVCNYNFTWCNLWLRCKCPHDIHGPKTEAWSLPLQHKHTHTHTHTHTPLVCIHKILPPLPPIIHVGL